MPVLSLAPVQPMRGTFFIQVLAELTAFAVVFRLLINAVGYIRIGNDNLASRPPSCRFDSVSVPDNARASW